MVAAPVSKQSGLVVRSDVPPGKKYPDYKHNLRIDFWFSCAYCTMTEVEGRGIGYQIDHYIPQSDKKGKALVHEYSNLLWSCSKCNRYKWQWFADPKRRNLGYRFLRPDRDDPREHYELEENSIVGTTRTGTYNVKALRLNRSYLRKLRHRRRQDYEIQDAALAGLHALREIPAHKLPAKMRRKFQQLKMQLEHDLREALGPIDYRQLGRSEALDPDESEIELSKEWREYLETLRAEYPGATFHPGERKSDDT